MYCLYNNINKLKLKKNYSYIYIYSFIIMNFSVFLNKLVSSVFPHLIVFYSSVLNRLKYFVNDSLYFRLLI